MLVLSLVLATLQQPAQTPAALPPLPTARTDTSPFRRLALPTPTLLREGSGRPGPRYWQQRVDYTIAVTLDTATHTIAGRETMRYTNHSPDTLRYVWLQLDQNLFRDDSRGALLNPPDARFAARGFKGGFVIDGVRAVGPSGRQAASSAILRTTENGTTMRVELDRALAPGGVTSLEIGYSFQVPEHGADRMGRERFPQGWLYEIAQWYPRFAVYDDVRGWNTEQYLGQGEFYLEYGNIDFAITVPRGFIVAGTGRLTNPLEVLTATERERLARALRSDSTVAIIARSEVGQASTRPAGTGATLTWRFSANNVRDVAWAAAPNFIWDASGWSGILMQSFYPPVADSLWRESTKLVRHSIKHYSEKWFPYPYPTAINVNGPVGGMEYPMIVFCGNRRSTRGLFGVTTHELGHQWFPMIVGSNERLYAWMDEGFNTFMNTYSARAFYHDTTGPGGSGIDNWAGFAGSGRDEAPSIMPADRVPGFLLGAAAYSKPAVGLFLLRHSILGDTTRFDGAFREYIRRWAFKHPTPADFFRSMEDGVGEDLSWFWRGWFYRTDVVDQAVDSILTARDSSGNTFTEIFLSNLGGLPMPLDLHLTFADGTTDNVRLPVEIWFEGNHFVYVRQLPKEVVKVEIDPNRNFPDVRRQNNTWSKPGATNARP
ncbi:MAG TPA: M1 family metallopeptidase [Gemmatimonadales bacterium]|nr:M1 family metallopeptidase [Gemmatimonadales bacterium]